MQELHCKVKRHHLSDKARRHDHLDGYNVEIQNGVVEFNFVETQAYTILYSRHKTLQHNMNDRTLSMAITAGPADAGA